MKKILTGNYAVAHAVKCAGAQVIAAYPITPQTSIVEKLVEFCSDGTLDAEFVTVESEHSALSCLIGASTAGVRVFTATSAQGLALMHEVLFWAAGSRLPIVMCNVNRAMAAPWTIWCDQTDSLAQRDTGWIQIYCENCQEAFDSILQAYKVAEKMRLPCMVNMDGFYLSHTAEPVEIPDHSVVDTFLPYTQNEFNLDIDKPQAFSSGTLPTLYYEFQVKKQLAMKEVERELDKIYEEFEETFGRKYRSVEPFEIDDAEMVLVTSGTISGTARSVVRRLRKEGKKIGLVKIRLFRPFPDAKLRQLLKGIPKVGIIDRNISIGNTGIFFSELRSALYSLENRPLLYGFITGLGGRDVVPSHIEEIVKTLERDEKPTTDTYWIGANHELV